MTIKCQPGDFEVEERLSPDFSVRILRQPGPSVLYLLEKSGLATPEAAALAARSLGVPCSSVAFAGLKDKYAHTTQHISVSWMRGADPAAAPVSAYGESWKISRLGWLASPITGAAIGENAFRVVVRRLGADECGRMDEAVRLLGRPGESAVSAPGRLRFVNYFGDQRFGSARAGRGFAAKCQILGRHEEALRLALAEPYAKEKRAGRELKELMAEQWGNWRFLLRAMPRCQERAAISHLVKRPGDFRGAMRMLPYLFQQMCVYAYQSHLWNSIARRLVLELCCRESEPIRRDDAYGELVFPLPAAVPEELLKLELPLLGRNSGLSGIWAEAARRVLEEEGLSSTRILRIPGVQRPFFGESMRGLFAEAGDFSLKRPEPDGPQKGERLFRRELRFTLPRGAYGTVLLRALGQ